MQVGHAHTMDYYFEPAAGGLLNRMETINVFGGDPVTVPIWRSSHGPDHQSRCSSTQPTRRRSSSRGPTPTGNRKSQAIETMLRFARAESIDEFGAGIEIFPRQPAHTYVDRDGNIAYWMTGYDPIRAAGVDPRLPSIRRRHQEWTGERRPRVHDANTAQGWYGGWNNKASRRLQQLIQQPWLRTSARRTAHTCVKEYLSTHDNLTFEEVRDLALNIATTDGISPSRRQQLDLRRPTTSRRRWRPILSRP